MLVLNINARVIVSGEYIKRFSTDFDFCIINNTYAYNLSTPNSLIDYLNIFIFFMCTCLVEDTGPQWTQGHSGTVAIFRNLNHRNAR